tara:strand:- start:178 stop:357 length:180 start_codon:yes stop_codon:yes gene_type:complete
LPEGKPRWTGCFAPFLPWKEININGYQSFDNMSKQDDILPENGIILEFSSISWMCVGSE